MKRTSHIALLMLLVSSFMVSSYAGELTWKTQTAGSQKEPLSNVRIEIDTETFLINEHEIPESVSKSIIEEALGHADRVTKKRYGVIYTYDAYGISFRTDVNNDIVSDITLYYDHRDNEPFFPDFAPKSLFAGVLVIDGNKLPRTGSILDVIDQIPAIKPDPRLFGNFYSVELGNRELWIWTTPQFGKIVMVEIGLPYESKKLGLLSLLKVSIVFTILILTTMAISK